MCEMVAGGVTDLLQISAFPCSPHEYQILKWMRALKTHVFGVSITGRSGLQLVCPCRSSKITQAPSQRFFRARPFGSARLRVLAYFVYCSWYWRRFSPLMDHATQRPFFGPKATYKTNS